MFNLEKHSYVQLAHCKLKFLKENDIEECRVQNDDTASNISKI